jgi:PBP1b-binding outer membrane lipoprotein LpoB
MKRITTFLLPLSALLCAALILQGCNSLNPLCGSARPAPGITALSATTVTFAQIQQGYLLTVTGTNIVSSSEIEINGNIEATQIISSTEAQITLNDIMIPAVGAANVTLHTPGGNSSDLACSSGGTSSPLTLTVTD